mmetsp:Transcript_7761/g.13774  ORF Transcript_7761/g.13774 Transcript_7761/m.13774 type:complete len:396 (-) Transcript_7761:73-1260(-)
MKGFAAGATITCFATLVAVLSDRNDYLELDPPAKDPCPDNCIPMRGQCDFFPELGTKGQDICDTCKPEGDACKSKSTAQTEDAVKELEEEDEPDEEPQPEMKKAPSQPESADRSESDSESDFEQMVRICEQLKGSPKCRRGKVQHADFNKFNLNPLPGWSCEAGARCLDTRVTPNVARGVVTGSTSQKACKEAFAPNVLRDNIFVVMNACVPYKCIFADVKGGICSQEDMLKEIQMLKETQQPAPEPALEQPVPLPQPAPVSGEPEVEPSAGPAPPEVAPPAPPEQREVGRVAKVSAPPSPPAKSPVQVCEAILANKDTNVFCRKGTMKPSDWKKQKVQRVTGFQQEPDGWTCTKAYKCLSTTIPTSVEAVVKGNSAAACMGKPAERTCIPEYKP